MESRGDRARQLFLDGYTCAQAVLLAFEDVTGLDEITAAKISGGFGGGMGRMREVCGAVSGALLIEGLLCGYDDAEADEAKKQLYARVRRFADAFRTENGSIICRELLSGVPHTEGGIPEARSEAYYRKRPCSELVAVSASVLEAHLREKKILL